MTTYDWQRAVATFGLDEPGCTYLPHGVTLTLTITEDAGAEQLLGTIRALYPHTTALGN
jgi:hypothetical protein